MEELSDNDNKYHFTSCEFTGWLIKLISIVFRKTGGRRIGRFSFPGNCQFSLPPISSSCANFAAVVTFVRRIPFNSHVNNRDNVSDLQNIQAKLNWIEWKYFIEMLTFNVNWFAFVASKGFMATATDTAGTLICDCSIGTNRFPWLSSYISNVEHNQKGLE